MMKGNSIKKDRIKINRASTLDIKEIADICKMSFPNSLEWQSPFFLQKQKFQTFLNNTGAEIYILRLDGKATGFAVLITDEIRSKEYREKYRLLKLLIALILKPWILFRIILKIFMRITYQKEEVYPEHSNLETNPQNRTWIEIIAISPAFRKMGLGRTLLDFLDRRTAEMKKDHIQLLVNAENCSACKLYFSHGYKIIRNENSKYILRKIISVNYHQTCR